MKKKKKKKKDTHRLTSATSSVRAVSMRAAEAAEALVAITLPGEGAAIIAAASRRGNLLTSLGALARTRRAVAIVARKVAETSVVTALAISDGALNAVTTTTAGGRSRSRRRLVRLRGSGRRVAAAGRSSGGRRVTATGGVRDGRVSSQRRLGLAGGDMEADGEGRKTVADEGVVLAGWDGADVGVEVVQTAGADVGDVHEGGGVEDGAAAALEGEVLLANTSGDGEDVSASGGLLVLGLAAGGDGDGTGALEEGDDVDDVVHGLPAVGTALEVVAGLVVGGTARGGIGRVAVEGAQSTAVPVDDLVLLDVVVDGRSTILVRGNEGLGELQPSIVGHVVGPLGVAVVVVLGVQGTNVVRLAIVVPGDNLNHGETLLKDGVPAIIQQRTAREDPVLGERHLGPEMGEEPRRHRSEVSLATEPVFVLVVAVLNGDLVTARGGLVVAVVVPTEPVESTVDLVRAGLARVEVGHEVDVVASSRAHSVDIQAVTGKRGGESAAVDLELGTAVLVLSNLLADAVGVAGAPPVEVEGDEDLHAVALGRLVGVTELLVGVAVNTNVKSKGVNAGILGAAHVIVVVGGAGTVTNNTNLHKSVTPFNL